MAVAARLDQRQRQGGKGQAGSQHLPPGESRGGDVSCVEIVTGACSPLLLGDRSHAPAS
jgi:hypothetical protein